MWLYLLEEEFPIPSRNVDTFFIKSYPPIAAWACFYFIVSIILKYLSLILKKLHNLTPKAKAIL